MALTDFPYSAVCYILANIPGEGEFQASGVIIGPHTILTAAHELWNNDLGVSADAVSVYPGFVPDGTTYNPPGALAGTQSIHFIKVPNNNGALTPAGTQSDFAIINTSADLSGFGVFALDPSFTRGDVIATGYPASSSGVQQNMKAAVSAHPQYSDLDSSNLKTSPGYSGGPLWDVVVRDESPVPAVVGTVSTGAYAMKLNKAKVSLIRHWIAADQSLYAGGSDAPRGVTPQIADTVSSNVNASAVGAQDGFATLAASVPLPYVYTDTASASSPPSIASTSGGGLSDLVDVLRGPAALSANLILSPPPDPAAVALTAPAVAAPTSVFLPHQGFSTVI